MTNFRSELPDIVNQAMAKADADRFASAAAFARAIERTAKFLYPEYDIRDSGRGYMRE